LKIKKQYLPGTTGVSAALAETVFLSDDVIENLGKEFLELWDVYSI
jgi:hypothetical protein